MSRRLEIVRRTHPVIRSAGSVLKIGDETNPSYPRFLGRVAGGQDRRDRPPGRRPGLGHRRQLDAARQLRRWSASRLARESGLARGTIQETLSGRRGRAGSGIEVRPSVETLLVLARTLGLSPDPLRRAGREDAAIALDLLGEEFDLSRVPIAALVNEADQSARADQEPAPGPGCPDPVRWNGHWHGTGSSAICRRHAQLTAALTRPSRCGCDRDGSAQRPGD